MKIIYCAEESWEIEYLASRLPHDEVVGVIGTLGEHPELADGDAEALSIFINSTVGAAELDRLPNLKLIATRSTGFDHIDLSEAKRRGIAVASVPSYGVNTVAEFAFALLLALVRKVPAADARLRDGSFDQRGLCGIDLAGKTIGIIGCGRIGAHAVRIAKGFGMEVIAYDMYENAQLAEELGFTYLPLLELLARADVISVHAPYAKETHHLLNEESLAHCKRGAYLINTARGAIIDSAALLSALKAGALAGAGLDVFEHERDMLDPTTTELLALPNVLLTPHVAFDTKEAIARILDTTIANITAFQTGAPQNIVPAL